MLPCIGDDGSFALKAMRNAVLSVLGLVDFIEAILQQSGESLLEELQGVSRGLDGPFSTITFGDFKGIVFDGWRLLKQNIRERGRFELQ